MFINFIKRNNDENMKGSMMIRATNNTSDVRFFDAVLYGVPVEIRDGLKIVDQYVVDKLLSILPEFKDMIFENCRFENITLNQILKLYECRFRKSQFVNVKGILYVNNCYCHECKLSECSLDIGNNGSNVYGCTFHNLNIQSCLFSHGSYVDNVSRNCDIVSCSFEESNIRKCSFNFCHFVKPDFLRAKLNGTFFHAGKIEEANYEEINVTLSGAREDEVVIHKNLILSILQPQ